MCGIAAVVPADISAVSGMLERMQERGPDSSAIFGTKHASLGVNRLAITDHCCGHQPLSSSSGTAIAVFNGAIYNVRELADKFHLNLSTGNDGEVICYLYEKFGLEFANYLEGMYAICITDLARSQLVIAVDPVGIKPMYISPTEAGWIAASTLQALPPDCQRIACRFPPGTVWSSSGEIVPIVPTPRPSGSVADLLTRSVAEQIPAEVSWGCMLSGGLDSSLVTVLAARATEPVKTFTSGLADSPDLIAAREVANFLGTDHHEELITDDQLHELTDTVIRVTASPDPHTVLAGIGTYVAARAAARQGIRVLLSGEGADELFGGYADYLDMPRDLVEEDLIHDQADLGATECLRLDRCTMAHSIEARVPFLSAPVIRKARSLPLAEKIDDSASPPMQKSALRRVAGPLLPDGITGRQKTGFADGAGLTDAIGRLARQLVSEREVRQLAASPGAARYLTAQRALGVDDFVSTLTWQKWSTFFSGMATGWLEMMERGLVRRSLKDGTYTSLSWWKNE